MPRNNHNGATCAVADLLKAKGPLTMVEIAGQLGLAHHTVRSCLSLMIGRLGGAMQVGKRGHAVLYGVPGRDNVVKPAKPRVNVAGPRYLAPQAGVLQRDPFEHRTLIITWPIRNKS